MRIAPCCRPFALATLLASPAPAAGDSLADRVPGDTLLYLSIDAKRMVDGTLGLDLVSLLEEAQMRDFLAPLAGRFPLELSTAGLREALRSLPRAELLDGRLEVALRGFELRVGDTSVAIAPSQPIDARMLNRMGAFVDAMASGGGGSVEVIPDVVMALDLGSGGEALHRRVVQALQGSGAPVVATDGTVGGRAATRLELSPGGGAPQVALHVAHDQQRCFLGGAKSLERLLAGPQGGSLAQDAAFQRCVGQVTSATPSLFAYFNVAHVARIFERFVPPIVKEEFDLLGVSSIESIGLASSFVAGGVRDSIALSWAQKPTGFLSLLDCVDGGFDYLAAAPADTGFYLGLRVAPEALVDRLVQVSEQIAPGSARGLEVAFAEFERASGMDLRESLLPAFGDEIGVWLTPPGAGAMLPGGMAVLEIGDRDQFARLLGMVRERAAGEGVTLGEARGLPPGCEGFTLTLPDAPFQPAFALTQDALCIAPNVLALKASLKAMAAAEGPGALANARLAQVLTGLTGQPAPAGLSLLAFVDLEQLVRIGWQFAPMAAQPMQESGLDPALLPEGETVASHFSGLGIAGRSDARGLMLSLFTPTGILPLAAAGALLAPHAIETSLPAPVAAAQPAAAGGAKTRPLAVLFANLERATGATIDYPDALADRPVSYVARSGELEVVLAELAQLVGFRYSIAQVDGEPLVTITQG